MSRMWRTRSRSGSSDGSRPAARVQLNLERLEELLLMSAVPGDMAYDQWRQQTFSIGSLDAQITTDALSGGPGAGALGNQGFQLIGGGQAHQYGYTGTGYTVAILDTGLNYNHSAFQGRYVGGWDFVDNDSNPMDENGHGTHVAGIIGSADATYRGVAPNVNLVALRVLDRNGSGSFGNVESALQWVANHRQQYNIVAVNMSLGAGNFTTPPWQFLDDELTTLKNQGVFVAAAAGNSFYSYGSQQGLGYPAINNLTVSVGAVWDGAYGSVSWASGAKDFSTAANRVASFSQRSSQLELMAPGAFITSTAMSGGFTTMAGTSMAAPMVAGAAVLIHQALDARGQGHLANQDHILSVMQSTGVTIVDGDDENDNVINSGLTFKRLDVYAAMRSIVTSAAPAPSNPPPAPTPAPPSGLSPNAAFISGLYQEVLGRPVDSAGLSAWTSALQSGMSRGQLVNLLWTSAEHRGLEITQFYSDLLHRTPSASERSGWISRFQAGATETDVIRAFLNSGEYASAHSSNASFINGVYQDLLGRSVDGAALSSWMSNLQAGVTRGQMIDYVLGSSERVGQVVGGYYQQYLGRSASAAETSSWVTSIGRGQVTLPGVAQMFLSSNEYFNRAGNSGAASLGDSDGALALGLIQEQSSGPDESFSVTRSQAFYDLGSDRNDGGGADFSMVGAVSQAEEFDIVRSSEQLARRVNQTLDHLMDALEAEELADLS